ncbi:hypothetical protein [uncultured Sulfitobacter sp.]|uniref:hypothetical protein n=1 Tax=uncultured Sulfitobacter sp. TaxID=191468 RepID=UPI00262D599B|nr:hypothetical protein [uncultured Sulfitobacter sp.]
MMRNSTSLNRHNAGRQAAKEVQQPIPLKPLAKYNSAIRIQSRKAANSLAQVNTQNFDILQNAPLSTYARNNSCGLAGRPFIPLVQYPQETEAYGAAEVLPKTS